jgi:non-homologous end joining protein Ku
VASRLSNAQVRINRPSEPSRRVSRHRGSCATFRSQIRSQHSKQQVQRGCAVCVGVVAYRDIARAYESDDGQTVIITDEDIATLPEERSREIEVLEFVPASEIDPLMYDRSNFLEPEGSRRSRMCCWPTH